MEISDISMQDLSSFKSKLYPIVIESICDNLLEEADKNLDELEGALNN